MSLQREAERDLTSRREGHGTTEARSNVAGLEAAGRVMTCRMQGMKLLILEKEEYSSQGPGESAYTLTSDQFNWLWTFTLQNYVRIHLYCFTTKSVITCYSSKKKLIQLTNTHILHFLHQTPSGKNQESTLPESLLILDSYQLLLNLTKNQSPPYLNSDLCSPDHCCRRGLTALAL